MSGLLVMVPRRIRPSPAASQPTHGSCSAPEWRTKGTLAWGYRPNDEPLNIEDVVALPEGFAPTPGDKDRAAILSGTSLALTKLSIRAHPLYRPLIADYLAVIKDLETGKHLKDLPERLRKTDATTASLRAELSRIEDYLDWFEATQQEEQGDEFRDYLRAEDELKRPPPPRNDPISRYLDEVAREFEE